MHASERRRCLIITKSDQFAGLSGKYVSSSCRTFAVVKTKKIMATFKPKKTKIEDTVVGTYQKIEDTVVGIYQKIEDKFVEKFLDVEDEDKK